MKGGSQHEKRQKRLKEKANEAEKVNVPRYALLFSALSSPSRAPRMLTLPAGPASEF